MALQHQMALQHLMVLQHQPLLQYLMALRFQPPLERHLCFWAPTALEVDYPVLATVICRHK